MTAKPYRKYPSDPPRWWWPALRCVLIGVAVFLLVKVLVGM